MLPGVTRGVRSVSPSPGEAGELVKIVARQSLAATQGQQPWRAGLMLEAGEGFDQAEADDLVVLLLVRTIAADGAGDVDAVRKRLAAGILRCQRSAWAQAEQGRRAQE